MGNLCLYFVYPARRIPMHNFCASGIISEEEETGNTMLGRTSDTNGKFHKLV